MSLIYSLTSRINAYLAGNDGQGMSECFDLHMRHFIDCMKTGKNLEMFDKNPYKEYIYMDKDTMSTFCSNIDKKSYGAMLESCIQSFKAYEEVCANFNKGDKYMTVVCLDVLFTKYAGVLSLLIREFSSSDGNWELPILKIVCNNLFMIADVSHRLQDCEGNVVLFGDLSRSLLKFLPITLTDRSPMQKSKRWGSLYILALLLKIYFRLNNIQLCKNILDVFENSQSELPKIMLFPRPERLAFCYYRARIHINHHEYRQAEALLDDAFRACPHSHRKNTRLILIYLVTVKLVLGHTPKKELLAKHNLEGKLYEMAKAVRTGDIKLFEQELDKNMEFLIRFEIFLIVKMRLKNILLRNLIKIIYNVLGTHNKIPMNTVLETINHLRTKYSSENKVVTLYHLDIDELECLVANLIFSGLIKGYLSHEKRMLVLSKKNPFPVE